MALKAGWTEAGGGMVKNGAGQLTYVGSEQYNNSPGDVPQSIDNGVEGMQVNRPVTTAKDVQNTPANVGQTTAQGQPTTIAQSFQQGLINRLNPAPVGTNSPEVQPAIAANQLAEQRTMSRNRNMLAERAAAQGFDASGGFETGLNGLAQSRAQREGQFAGNAVQRANEIQNSNATNALGVVGNLLTGNANRDQALTLAQMADATQRYGIGTQADLGSQDIGLRRELGNNANNLSLLGLLMNNDQFGRSLGQNASQFGASLDQNGLLGLLGLL